MNKSSITTEYLNISVSSVLNSNQIDPIWFQIDPIGFSAPYTLKGKQGYQDLIIVKNLGWDDLMPSDILKKIRSYQIRNTTLVYKHERYV